MPSKKQMKQAKKLKQKIVYPSWSKDEKLKEVLKIREQLIDLGLGVYEEEMNKFNDICQDYIKKV